MAPPQQLDPSFFSQQPYVRERRPQKPRGKSPLGERVRFVGLLRARAAAGVAGAGSTRNHQKKTSTAVMACCVMQGTASLSFAPVSQSVVFALDNQRQMLSMLSNGLAASWKGQQEACDIDHVARDQEQLCEQDSLAPVKLGLSQCSIQQAFYLFSDGDLEYLRSCMCGETRVQADAAYLDTTQQEVDAHKRLMLVDWLVEVVDEFQLSQETLFLAVTLLDRFMSVKAVLCCQLQLLGVTCLWVAAKYEEVMPPSLQSFVEITDNSYAASDLIQMEAILLTTLGFELAVPTSLHFLHQLLAHAQMETGSSSPRGPCHPLCPTEAVLVHLAEYLLELALLTPDTLRFRPSVVAASALQLSADMLTRKCDPCSRAAYSNLCWAISDAVGTELDECMQELQHMHTWAGSAAQPPCVREKYSDSEHSYVGILKPHHLT